MGRVKTMELFGPKATEDDRQLGVKATAQHLKLFQSYESRNDGRNAEVCSDGLHARIQQETKYKHNIFKSVQIKIADCSVL